MNTPIRLETSWPISDPPSGSVFARIFAADGETAIGDDIEFNPQGNSVWSFDGTADLPDSVDSPLLWEGRFVASAGGEYETAPIARTIGELGYVKGGKIVFPPLFSADTLQTIAAQVAPLVRAIVGTVGNDDSSPAITDTLSMIAGDTWSKDFSIPGFDTADWTKLEFIVKSDPQSDADSESMIFVRLSNPPQSDDGLIFTRGRKADNEQRAGGSLSFSTHSPDTFFSLDLSADATDIPTQPDEPLLYRYGIVLHHGAGVKRTIAEGDFAASPGVGG